MSRDIGAFTIFRYRCVAFYVLLNSIICFICNDYKTRQILKTKIEHPSYGLKLDKIV